MTGGSHDSFSTLHYGEPPPHPCVEVVKFFQDDRLVTFAMEGTVAVEESSGEQAQSQTCSISYSFIHTG